MTTLTSAKLYEIAQTAIQHFSGEGTVLESAIGALYVGNAYGWRVLFLIHGRSTIRKYERILSIKFQECVPEDTPLSRRSIAYRALKGVTNFWKAVKGEIGNVRSTKLLK